MMVDRRVLALVVMALIAGAALALAVALAGGGPASQVTGLATYSSAVQSPAGVPAQTQDLGATQPDPLAVDPARSAPMLDQFQPKDPFIPLQTPTPAPNPTSNPTPAPTPEPTPEPSNKKAVVKVNGVQSTVVTGDKVPSGDPAFKITSITATDVTFTLLSGQFSDGSSSVTVNLGEAVKVQNESGGTSYTLSVIKIGASSSGGATHGIAVLSITTKNGEPVVTLRVGSVTYSDVTSGAVLSTSQGEIRIVSINASAQTVTLVWGSATLTLHTGQVVPK